MQIIIKDSELTNKKTDEEIAYEMASKEATAFTNVLLKTYEKLGKPETFVGSISGQKMLLQIWRLWKRAYPQQYADHTFLRQTELQTEKSKQDLVKNLGYVPISYPVKIYYLIKGIFPNVNISDKEVIKEMIKVLPELVVTNLKI